MNKQTLAEVLGSIVTLATIALVTVFLLSL